MIYLFVYIYMHLNINDEFDVVCIINNILWACLKMGLPSICGGLKLEMDDWLTRGFWDNYVHCFWRNTHSETLKAWVSQSYQICAGKNFLWGRMILIEAFEVWKRVEPASGTDVTQMNDNVMRGLIEQILF